MREQEIWEEAEEKGREKEREEGIRGMVTVLKELGIPSKTILSKIQKQYNLSPEISKKYLWKIENGFIREWLQKTTLVWRRQDDYKIKFVDYITSEFPIKARRLESLNWEFKAF